MYHYVIFTPRWEMTGPGRRTGRPALPLCGLSPKTGQRGIFPWLAGPPLAEDLPAKRKPSWPGGRFPLAQSSWGLIEPLTHEGRALQWPLVPSAASRSRAWHAPLWGRLGARSWALSPTQGPPRDLGGLQRCMSSGTGDWGEAGGGRGRPGLHPARLGGSGSGWGRPGPEPACQKGV